jgi:hypothetical protein
MPKRKMKQSITSGAQEPFVMMDLTAPGKLEVTIRRDGKVIWINSKAGCLFRACQCESILLYDQRNPFGVKHS